MEDIENSQDLEKSLEEVRKAYRLIALYQKRILDLVNYIRIQYQFEFEFGLNKVTNKKSTNSKKIDTNSWNWLDLYYYLFHFKPQIDKDQKLISFFILLVNDTGYFQKKSKITEVENFGKLVDSETKIILTAGKGNKKKTPFGNYGLFDRYDNADNNDSKFKIDSNQYEFIKEDRVGKAFLIEKFKNAYETRKSLNNFAKFCKVNLDIDLFEERIKSDNSKQKE